MHEYTHFSDHWLRTSAAIHVYKARAIGGTGTGCVFFSVYIL